jgi:hypothetical protein
MNTPIQSTSMTAALPSLEQMKEKNKSGNWFEAMSQAWGDTLNKTANTIEGMSNAISQGDDTPAAITALSTESLRMNFLSTSAHTAIASVGSALEAMARKQ